jgi:RNA polymerase sigma-70 factor (ECF subfamily)
VLEDKVLVWRFKRGNKEAFCRIYEKYRDDLLRLAVSLLNETGTAEDVVHDVFISFIRSSRQFELTGSLKGYLATCVANRACNVSRAYRRKENAGLDKVVQIASDFKRPDQWIISSEELQQLSNALAQLPYSQREAITLHLQAGMKFREIAEFQEVPTNTAQSRYRCGLDKLRSLLNSEVTK